MHCLAYSMQNDLLAVGHGSEVHIVAGGNLTAQSEFFLLGSKWPEVYTVFLQILVR